MGAHGAVSGNGPGHVGVSSSPRQTLRFRWFSSKSADAGKLSVGFSQIGAESAWRIANTESIKAEAAKRGIDLKFTDAQQKQENQIRSLRSFISQNVDVIAFSPVVTTGWEPVLREIKDAGIPVVGENRAQDLQRISAGLLEPGQAGAFVAVRVGSTRLIDNVILGVDRAPLQGPI